MRQTSSMLYKCLVTGARIPVEVSGENLLTLEEVMASPRVAALVAKRKAVLVESRFEKQFILGFRPIAAAKVKAVYPGPY